ncbi:MAG: hypothetical protein Q9178_003821 [Gyalolechia marmorata]
MEIHDEGAKFGTEIDGERVAPGSSTLLKNDEHSFRLGKTAHIFRIRWQPVVLSVSFGSKDTKAGKDPLAHLQSRLEHTDIKAVGPYIIGQTTHVVQAKRNTAKGLQALINGKYIVYESFIDALVYATAPTDFDHDESLTPLEEDFRKHWPDPMQHVPPKGKEPNDRPFEAFAPNPERANVFEGYSFVLCEKTQFETLQGPITNGGGKAMYFELKPGQTSTDELVGYVKSVAGEKGLGELEDGSEGKGVVVVKFRGDKGEFEWAAELVRTASLALDLRFIEQNEFMDAILMNDASMLRRPLEMAQAHDEPDSRNHISTQTETTSIVQNPQPEPQMDEPQAQTRQRGLIKSRFKAFSDDSDDDDIKSSLSGIPQEGFQMQTQTPNQRPLPSEPSQPSHTRKRLAPAAEEDEEDLVDQLLPAATAIKRRRLQETEAALLRGEPPPTTSFSNESTTSAPTVKKPPPPPELDIKKSLRERREAADRAAARDQDTLHEDLSTTDIEALRNLAVVEEFDIKPHIHPSRHHQNGTAINGNGHASDSRWDPAWNGRKNFKKFHHQGDPNAGNVRRGAQGVIVPLEEVQKKAYGIGEEYWLESGSGKGKRKRGERTQMRTQNQMQMVQETNSSLVNSSNSGGVREKAKPKQKAKVQEEEEEEVPREVKMETEDDGDETMLDDDDDVVNTQPPRRRRTRGMDTTSGATQPTQASKSKSQPLDVSSTSTVGAGGKGETQKGGSESEGEGDLKFRFRKKRREGY